MNFRRPQFEDLPEEAQLAYGNGVGPDRFPPWLRAFITIRAGWFLEDANWRHHDFGYVIGGDEFDRWRCDWKFYRYMLKDAMTQSFLIWIIGAPIAVLIATFFFLSVLFVGWTSFNYQTHYSTTEEARTAFLTDRNERRGVAQ